MVIDETLKEDELSEYRNIGLGALLAAFVIVMPQGVVGALEDLYSRIKTRRDA